MNLIKKVIVVWLISALYVPSLWATGPFPDTNKQKQVLRKVNPKVVYVNQYSRADCPDGSSWSQAFSSLSEALTSNLIGKNEIWVARGTYYPTKTTQREASFALVSGVGIYGGFMGNELLRSQRDWSRNSTVLSGEIGDPARLSDNSYHVVTGADNALIDGFIIRDGYALPGEGENDESGCLVKVPEKMAGTPILGSVTNIKFCSGGGLLNLHAGTYARNCRFLSNYAVNGGAVYNMITRYWDPDSMESTISGPSPVFENCIFEDNHAKALGGAVNNAFLTRTTFAGCIFSDNSCKDKGGAVYADMVSPVYMMNVLFSNNEAERGAALAAEGASPHRLVFATFTCNMAYDIGAALYQGAYMDKQTDGTPFIGNEVHLYRSLVMSNVSISSPTSISSWHDSTVIFDAESVAETVDGTIVPGRYLLKKSFVSKSTEAGFNPAREINIAYWINRFDGDENRTYYRYDYDTSSKVGEPGVIYVDDDAAPDGDGSSWARAFCDLNFALEQAAAGSQIWVTKGVYTPTDSSDRAVAFVMKEGVDIYGGFSGTETTLEERKWAANVTVLSGDIGEKGDPSDNSYHVVFGASDSLLDGFVIQDGMASGNFDHGRGGGLLCDRKASPKILNSSFNSNQAKEGGAIAIIGYAAPVMENCTISANNARSGGGILFRTGPDNRGPGTRLIDVELMNNTAEDRGGAVYIDYGAWADFTRCTLSGNMSTGNGGGVYVDNNFSSRAHIEIDFNACFLTENTTGLRGGAFAIYEGAVFLKDTVVNHNDAVSGGGGIALDYKGAFLNEKNTSLIQENTSTSGRPDID